MIDFSHIIDSLKIGSILAKMNSKIAILLAFGFVFVLASMFCSADYFLFVFILGCVLLIVAIYKMFSPAKSINSGVKNCIKKESKHKHSVISGELEGKYSINIIYGSIRNIKEYENENKNNENNKKPLVVLSTDYKFSDKYIDDSECVLSSFVNGLDPNERESFEKQFNNAKKKKPEEQRYVYLSNSESGESNFNTVIVAVTNKDEERTNSENIMQAFNDVYKIAIENDIITIYIPLIGSGKDGLLTHKLSFLNLLISILENEKSHRVNVSNINIIIYKNKKDKKPPPISEDDMKAIVNFVLKYFKP